MSGRDPIDFDQRLAAFGYDARSYASFPAVRRAIGRHAPVALYRHIAATPAIRGLFSRRRNAAPYAGRR